MGEFNLEAYKLQERCFYMSKTGLVEIIKRNKAGLVFRTPTGQSYTKLWCDVGFNTLERKYRLATMEEYKKQGISEENYEIF